MEFIAKIILLVVSAGTVRSLLLGSHTALWLFLGVYTMPGRCNVPQPTELPYSRNRDFQIRLGCSAGTRDIALGMQAARGALHVEQTCYGGWPGVMPRRAFCMDWALEPTFPYGLSFGSRQPLAPLAWYEALTGRPYI